MTPFFYRAFGFTWSDLPCLFIVHGFITNSFVNFSSGVWSLLQLFMHVRHSTNFIILDASQPLTCSNLDALSYRPAAWLLSWDFPPQHAGDFPQFSPAPDPCWPGCPVFLFLVALPSFCGAAHAVAFWEHCTVGMFFWNLYVWKDFISFNFYLFLLILIFTSFTICSILWNSFFCRILSSFQGCCWEDWRHSDFSVRI